MADPCVDAGGSAGVIDRLQRLDGSVVEIAFGSPGRRDRVKRAGGRLSSAKAPDARKGSSWMENCLELGKVTTNITEVSDN